MLIASHLSPRALTCCLQAVLMTTIDWCGNGKDYCDFGTIMPADFYGTYAQVFLSPQGVSPVGFDNKGNTVA